MATKKQQQELIEILKFTPIPVNLQIQGYGGECYSGKISREDYEFFKKHKYDIEEYASSWDDEWHDRVPKEHQIFPPGSGYECDDLFHASGAELSNSNYLEIINARTNETVWTIAPGLNELEDAGVTVEENGGADYDDLDEGTIVYWGGQGEKGCFFDAEFTLRAPFDPKKLKVTYENCDGWLIINGVEYDGEELDGTGGYSTSGKWAENKFIIIGDEEVYEPVSMEDREEGVDYTKFPTDEEIASLEEMECVQCDWRGTVDETYDVEGQMVCPKCREPVEFTHGGEPEQDEQAYLEKQFDAIIAKKEKSKKELEVTEWYPVSINPVRKGSYDIDLGENVKWPMFRYSRAEWSGRTWKDVQGDKVKGVRAWRGLAHNPELEGGAL